MTNAATFVRAFLPGLLLLAAFGLVSWWLLTLLASFLRSLQSDLAVAIVAAGLAGLVSIVSLALSKAYETRSAIRQDLRAKKLPVYEGIVGTLFTVMFAEKIGKTPLQSDDLVKWFAETTEKLSIWGSDELVLAFGKFKNGFSDENPGLFGFEELILAIRKDLGHNGRKLKRGSILSLFVTDIDRHLT